MNNDPMEVFDYTKKQRLQLLANLLADKIKEDVSQSQPLLKQIEVERDSERKHDRPSSKSNKVHK